MQIYSNDIIKNCFRIISKSETYFIPISKRKDWSTRPVKQVEIDPFSKASFINAVNKPIMHSLIHSTERKKKIYDPQFIISSRDFYLEIILIYTHINKNRINSVKISLINALTSLFVFSPPPPSPLPHQVYSQYKHESQKQLAARGKFSM